MIRICVTIVFLGLTALFSCKKKEQSGKPKYEPFVLSDTMLRRCEFTIVEKDTVKSELNLFGKIQADNSKMAHVDPVVGGSVVRINVELGDYVRQGQVLAVVQSGEVAEFQKERLNALNDVSLAEKNLSVAKDLFEGKLNSEKDVIVAEKDLEKARAELNRINEVYKIYNLKGGSIYNVTAPISGFIVYKNINQNETLRADKSEQIFSIAEINEVWALANVNESDISKIKMGLAADVKTISFPDDIYHGKIDKIFNAIDPETKAMKVLVKIPNPQLKLKPEMNAKVTLHMKLHTQKIAIPSSSVIFDNNKNWVMITNAKNEVETRQIEVDHQYKDIMYISSGLSVGDKIISKNGLYIYDAVND